MAIEQEIKLALPAAQVDAARRFLDARAGASGREIALVNVYFDTPTLTLARAKSALRLRRAPQGWLQTFKTAGMSERGLHRRHEWEMPVAGEALEIDALCAACDVPGAADALRAAAPQLIALFRTDFSRTLWRIEHAGTTIEAALDRGEIVAQADGDVRREPICEIELELVEGDAGALATLADEVAVALPGVAPDNLSKAQRGYRLRGGDLRTD
ncbi:CYTH domain-containing protein [Burkholderia thailandensis]|uniref:CYTH domain protein n=1 Tax=Burkholderia thailandensis TaxID=57975 RepID=A0AAW9D4F4_BURTH|nr:CYTH domain-containing protein [Burkholderia thailandensis]AHI64011.1 CYTH domain protein [Burkholderia thailandensis H0587]AIP63281.1 adenylate cyclase [Burkholderia thailandensis]AJY29471.1 CYTH domain protein [Burkholderia thailandensis 34]AOI50767.1 adenylate cyclase [Burkholderia thailandensis]AOJ49790.1 adenylate cyclase [Burkholderia thailandensis]